MSFLPSKFFVVAHRGASAYEPENTLRAIAKAVDLGAPVVEVDVRRCKSGELVIFHDEDLSRLFNINTKLSDLTLQELRKYKVGGIAEIPTLNEVLEFVKGKVKLFIEVKEKGIEGSVVSMVRDSGLLDDVAIISFYHEVIVNVKNLEPKAHVGLITSHPYLNIHNLTKYGVEILLPRHNLVTGRLVKEVRSRGIKIIPWVVNDVALAIKLRNLGVDGIASDKPDIINEMDKII